MGGKTCFFPLLMLLPLIGACSFFLDYREVEVIFPDLPDHWDERFQTVAYELRFPDYTCSDNICRLLVEAGTESVIIQIPKERYVPCTARPLPEEGICKPAGIILAKVFRIAHLKSPLFSLSGRTDLLRACCSAYTI